jgi:hypothetical protein
MRGIELKTPTRITIKHASESGSKDLENEEVFRETDAILF